MKTQRTTQRLAEVVVAILCRMNPSATCVTLGSFTLRDWERSFYWLDASGAALYFLEAVKQQRLESFIPLEVFRRLEQNQADNRMRTAHLFDEFVKINETFRHSGVRYVTLKGFALAPDYCRDLSLRYQTDLDFLISPTDGSKCREVIKEMGYRLKGVSDYIWEYQAGEDQPPAIDRLYKPRTERAIELHLANPPISITSTDDLIGRSGSRSCNGFSFPVLSPRDMFLSQSFHLLRHIRSEWTRLSWFLEFKHFVCGRRDDQPFWGDIRRHTEGFECATGIGVVILLATELFGEFAPLALTEWSVDTLPVPVRLWVSRYARQAMLAEFPGTKLYLLLEPALVADTASCRKARRGKLFPARLPRKIVASGSSTISTRMRGRLIQMRYILFRLWFHIAAGFRYGLEVRRWNHALLLAEEVKPSVANEDGYALMASSANK